MPSFSSTLEQAIHSALALANERRHEFATLEHLLLALLDEPDATRVMKACSVDLDELRATLVALSLELATNPFLRAADPGIRRNLGMQTEPDAAVFAEIRGRKDRF